MNRFDFVSEVYEDARSHGVPFIEMSDYDRLLQFIGRRLFDFVERTRVLYDETVTFSLTSAGDGTYDLSDTTVVSKAVIQPRVVLIDNVPLLDEKGRPGLVSIQDADDWATPDYRNVTDNRPQKAFLIPPSTLRLVPAPDATYSGTISGWVQHTALTALTDESAMELPDKAIDAAIQYCAGWLIKRSTDVDGLRLAQGLIDDALKEGQEYASKANRDLIGDPFRTPRRNRTYILT